MSVKILKRHFRYTYKLLVQKNSNELLKGKGYMCKALHEEGYKIAFSDLDSYIFINLINCISSLWVTVVYGGAALYLPTIPQTKQSFYLLVAATAACHVVFCCLLVYGAFGRNPSYLWPWLVASWMSCAGLVLFSLLGILLLTLQYHEDIETSVEISTMSSIYFVYAVILYYCTRIVDSRREQMIREEERESSEKLMRLRDIPKTLLV